MSEIVKTYFWVAAGSALGGMGRFWLSNLFEQAGNKIPWTTLFINVSGSFLIGLLASLTDPTGRFPASPALRHFFMAGLCGGYTTFSAFSWQTLKLAQNGAGLAAASYVLLSILLCFAGVWLGYWLGQMANR